MTDSVMQIGEEFALGKWFGNTISSPQPFTSTALLEYHDVDDLDEEASHLDDQPLGSALDPRELQLAELSPNKKSTKVFVAKTSKSLEDQLTLKRVRSI